MLSNFVSLILLTGVQNVAFFFSAISAQGPQNSRGKKKQQQPSAANPESDDNNEEFITSSQVSSNTSQE